MTTSIRVNAHCTDTKEVVVLLNGAPHAVLQDGQTAEFLVYDSREISVKEVVKTVPTPDMFAV